MRNRFRPSRRWLILASAIAGVRLVCPGSSSAETWISATDGSWSDATKWNSLPAPGPSTVLVFSPTGTQTYTATDDLPLPFLLTSLQFAGTSTGSVTLGAGSLSTMRFAGAGPTINNSSVSQVTIQGRASIASGALNLLLTAPNNNATTINAVLTGAGGLTMSPTGTGSVQLTARNTFSGGASFSGGQYDLATQTSLGTGTLTANGGTLSTSLFVAPQGYGPVFPAFSNNITLLAGGMRLGGNFGYTLAGNIAGAGGLTVSPANLLSNTWTLSGSNSFTGSLTVSGPASGVTNTLVINSPSSLGNASTINLSGNGARIAFATGTTAFTVNKPMQLTTGGAIVALNTITHGKLVYAGKISGTGGLTILPPVSGSFSGGSVTLAGSNDFTGGLNLVGGTTAVNSFENFGASGSTVTFSGGSLVLNPAFGATSRKFNVAVTGSTLYNFDDVTFNGIISNVSSQGFTKSGAGNLICTASSTFSGPLLISGGTITVAGPGGVLTSGVGTISIDAGSGLVLDNTFGTVQHVSSTGSIIFTGGNFTQIGNGTSTVATTINTTMTIGSSINQSGSGYSVMDIQGTDDAATQVKFSTLSRAGNSGTQVLFTGQRLGQFAVSTPTVGATNFSFTNSPASQLVNSIFPWAIADAIGGPGTDFATYNVANGIQPLAVYSSDFVGGLTANVAVSAATLATGTTTASCNSLKLAGGTVTNASSTLTIGSGAILSVNAASAITGGTLVIGTGTTNTTSAPTANFFCISDLTVNSAITNFDPSSGLASGISKAGAGVLLLSGTNTYTGPTRVLSGTLRLGAGTAIPSASDVYVNPGATLDLNGFNATIGSVNQTVASFTTGNNNYGTISIGSMTLTAGGNDNSSVFQGNITGNGSFTKQGAGTLTVIGSQAFTGTVTLAKGALVLETHSIRGTAFSSAGRINLGAGTNGTSADVVLGIPFGVENFSVPITVQTITGRTATLQFIQGLNGTAGTTFASPITFNSGTSSVGTTGLIVDSSGGVTMSGVISGIGSLMTVSTATTLAAGSLGFAVNFTGTNTFNGTTTFAAPATLWGNVSAFGNSTSQLILGSSDRLDNPELSSSVGGLTLTRNILVNDSTNAVAAYAMLGSRAPAGAGTTTYSGTISIGGAQRSKLILYSLNGAPVAFTSAISGAMGTANVQVGGTIGTGLEFTNSNVTLSGSSTFAGGLSLYCGTLNLGNSTTVNGPSVQTGPLGTGTFFIGTSGLPGATEPTINAVGAIRTIANPSVVMNNFTIGAGSALILSGPMDLNAGARLISVNNVSTFSGNITGAAGSALMKDGTGTMQLVGSATFSGPFAVDAGTVSVQTTQKLNGALSIGASAAMVMKSGGATFLTTPAISIDSANGGFLDMTDDDAVIDYTGATPIAAIKKLISVGWAGGAWTGLGITSTTAAGIAATVGNFHKTALGYADASAVGIGTFAGGAVDSTSVLIRYTYSGDANLDGTVNNLDFTALAQAFNSSGQFWQNGDFNFDGVVNGLDFNAIATNFGLNLPGPLPSSVYTSSLVPEPAALLLLPALGLARRRRNSAMTVA